MSDKVRFEGLSVKPTGALAKALANGAEIVFEDWGPMAVDLGEAPPRKRFEGLLWWLGFERYA